MKSLIFLIIVTALSVSVLAQSPPKADILNASLNNFELTQDPDFTRISARAINGLVRISWEADGVQEKETFYIERSSDGQHFATLGDIPASRTGSNNFEDRNPNSGINYYRIAIGNPSEKKLYSETISVRVLSRETLNAFLNNGNLVVQVKDLKTGSYKVILVNASGQPVMNDELKHNSGQDLYRLNLTGALPSGIYSIILRGNNGVSVTRQVLLK
ncbi:MAG: T9SS type A sorting domain-containing protein [Chitinophagaceae bacterium]|nr:T9SS type A sorting domain-containing protein [Chitinophagaceae bacterium]